MILSRNIMLCRAAYIFDAGYCFHARLAVFARGQSSSRLRKRVLLAKSHFASQRRLAQKRRKTQALRNEEQNVAQSTITFHGRSFLINFTVIGKLIRDCSLASRPTIAPALLAQPFIFS